MGAAHGADGGQKAGASAVSARRRQPPARSHCVRRRLRGDAAQCTHANTATCANHAARASFAAWTALAAVAAASARRIVKHFVVISSKVFGCVPGCVPGSTSGGVGCHSPSALAQRGVRLPQALTSRHEHGVEAEQKGAGRRHAGTVLAAGVPSRGIEGWPAKALALELCEGTLGLPRPRRQVLAVGRVEGEREGVVPEVQVLQRWMRRPKHGVEDVLNGAKAVAAENQHRQRPEQVGRQAWLQTPEVVVRNVQERQATKRCERRQRYQRIPGERKRGQCQGAVQDWSLYKLVGSKI